MITNDGAILTGDPQTEATGAGLPAILKEHINKRIRANCKTGNTKKCDMYFELYKDEMSSDDLDGFKSLMKQQLEIFYKEDRLWYRPYSVRDGSSFDEDVGYFGNYKGVLETFLPRNPIFEFRENCDRHFIIVEPGNSTIRHASAKEAKEALLIYLGKTGWTNSKRAAQEAADHLAGLRIAECLKRKKERNKERAEENKHVGF